MSNSTSTSASASSISIMLNGCPVDVSVSTVFDLAELDLTNQRLTSLPDWLLNGIILSHSAIPGPTSNANAAINVTDCPASPSSCAAVAVAVAVAGDNSSLVCEHVRSLCVRLNFLSSVAPFRAFKQLTELDLYENHLTTLAQNENEETGKEEYEEEEDDEEGEEQLQSAQQTSTSSNVTSMFTEQIEIENKSNECKAAPLGTNASSASSLQRSCFPASIRILDLSFNALRRLGGGVRGLQHLERLYLVHNKLTEVRAKEFEGLHALKLLELGSNRLRRIPRLFELFALEELWLGKNKITKIENLSPLCNLRRLSLQSNRITSMAGIEQLTSLEELYLSHNAIAEVQALNSLRRLRVLDLSANVLTSSTNSFSNNCIASQTLLEELWLGSNRFDSFSIISVIQQHCPKLQTLYLECNPLWQGLQDAEYVRKCLTALPTLTQLDALPVQEYHHMLTLKRPHNCAMAEVSDFSRLQSQFGADADAATITAVTKEALDTEEKT